MVSVVVYEDREVDPESAEMQPTCRLGTQTLQDFTDKSDMLTIDCVLPFIE